MPTVDSTEAGGVLFRCRVAEDLLRGPCRFLCVFECAPHPIGTRTFPPNREPFGSLSDPARNSRSRCNDALLQRDGRPAADIQTVGRVHAARGESPAEIGV